MSYSWKVVRLMPRTSTIPGFVRYIKRTDVPAHYTDAQALEVAGTTLGSRMVRGRRERIADPSAQRLIAAGDYSITIETN